MLIVMMMSIKVYHMMKCFPVNPEIPTDDFKNQLFTIIELIQNIKHISFAKARITGNRLTIVIVLLNHY